MSNTNRTMVSRQLDLELEQKKRILTELKETYAKKKEFNDRLEANLNACGWTIRATNKLGAKATALHNELVDGYEMVQNKLKAAIKETEQGKADDQLIKADKEKESKKLDDEIAKAECDKMQLKTKLEQLDMNEAKSKKDIEELRAHVEKSEAEVEAFLRTNARAKNDKNSKKVLNIQTPELDSLQENLTPSDERLMDFQGIEQESFLDHYFADAVKIKQEPVTD